MSLPSMPGGNVTYNIRTARTALFLVFFILPFRVANPQTNSSDFAIHDADRITFFGDSITEQREYTEDVEEYVLTRYPTWKVSFHNAGVGGDKVSGGGGGAPHPGPFSAGFF